MASEVHLRQLAHGVESWNRWRAENPSVQPDLSAAVLTEVVGPGANLTAFNLSGVDLSRADLTGVSLGGDDQTGADLLLASEGITNVESANSPGVDLSRARLSGANLHSAYLFMVNLTEAVLVGADLGSADLSLANLSGADLTRSNLAGASLRRATLRSARLSDTDLSSTRYLRTSRVDYDCFVDRETLLKSGLLPIEFLRRCGLSEELIAETRELLGVPRGTLSCFVSHTTRDRPFVDRLQEDLARHAIKCWYSPRDMARDGDAERPYDETRGQLETAIDIHDRTLVVLSEASLRRSWVELELRAASGEDPDWSRVNQLVLVRLDRAHEHVGLDLRFLLAGRAIVDFVRWEQPGRYDAALEQLVQILRGCDPEGDLISGGRVVLDKWWKPFDVVDIGKPISADERRRWRRPSRG